jgi:hypothetical protein
MRNRRARLLRTGTCVGNVGCPLGGGNGNHGGDATRNAQRATRPINNLAIMKSTRVRCDELRARHGRVHFDVIGIADCRFACGPCQNSQTGATRKRITSAESRGWCALRESARAYGIFRPRPKIAGRVKRNQVFRNGDAILRASSADSADESVGDESVRFDTQKKARTKRAI